jgi:hypothetical protein
MLRGRDDGHRTLLWVPNLRWFLPHQFALSLARLSDAGFEPRLAKHYLQPAVTLHAAADDVHYYLEPKEVSIWESVDTDECNTESLAEEEHTQEAQIAQLVGYDSIGTINGIIVWRTKQPQAASIPDERIAKSQQAVTRPTTLIMLSGWLFVAMALLLFWISIAATDLGVASQREHGYGAVFTLAVGAPTVILTLLYRASWRRYWRQILEPNAHKAE